jgi:hypothetical protein
MMDSYKHKHTKNISDRPNLAGQINILCPSHYDQAKYAAKPGNPPYPGAKNSHDASTLKATKSTDIQKNILIKHIRHCHNWYHIKALAWARLYHTAKENRLYYLKRRIVLICL